MDTYRPAVGTPIEDLDTPCLLVDLDALEHNQSVIADTYRDTVCKMAPHVKNTKCPIIIHMQFRAGGTAESVCSAKVSEAEVMVGSGIRNILIANQVAAKGKIERLCSLAKRATMRVTIDNPRNVRALSEAATRHGVTIGVVIEVSVRESGGRGGVRRMAPGGLEQGVELAKLAESLPGIAFKGVMSHQSLPGKPDRETRFLDGPPLIQRCLDMKDAIEAAGIPVEVVSSGETFSYDIAPTMPGVTEVEGGTYMLMSHPFDYMTEFDIAGKVLGTVISTPRPGVAIGDVGSRGLVSMGALPQVDGMPGITVKELHEEHIILDMEAPARLEVGDQFLLTSGQQDFMTDRWDQHIAVRNGVVEAVWPILARGCYH
jgi:3-hydroxy-D-aspartate aldolase